MYIKDKLESKHNHMKQQFGCGYYSVCCRDDCPCSLKLEGYDPQKLNMLKNEFDKEAIELFG